MTDENKQVEQPGVETEPTEKKPEPGQQERTFTQSELEAIIKDRLERVQKKFTDYDDLRAKAEKLDKIEEANMSEAEKLHKQIAELQSKAEQAEASRLAAEREKEIVSEATKLNFEDPNDAVRLVGDAEDIEEALKELADKKPYLLRQEKQPKPNLKPSSPGAVEKKETRAESKKRRFGVSGADVLAPENAADKGGGVLWTPVSKEKIENQSPDLGSGKSE
jgi:hypothetical protein